MSREHMITTKPNEIICPRCRAVVLAATIGGLDRHVDTSAVTPEGELRALTAGLATFELRGIMADLLIRRGPEQIRAGAQGPVLVEHTCHPIPDRYVDRGCMVAALGLVARLLGAMPAAGENTPPPY